MKMSKQAWAYPDGSLLNYPRLRLLGLLHEDCRGAHRPHEPGISFRYLTLSDGFLHCISIIVETNFSVTGYRVNPDLG